MYNNKENAILQYPTDSCKLYLVENDQRASIIATTSSVSIRSLDFPDKVIVVYADHIKIFAYGTFVSFNYLETDETLFNKSLSSDTFGLTEKHMKLCLELLIKFRIPR